MTDGSTNIRLSGIDFIESRKHAWANTLHTWLLVGGSLLLLAVCAWIFMGSSGVFYAIVFGGISLFVASRVSPDIVLRMYKAREVNAREFPVGHQILDLLSERAELAVKPKLYVVPSKMMNAFAVGRINQSAVALTDQLIRNLTARELAGVMAHEVTHIKNQDVRVMAIADMVSRFTSLMSTIGMFALFINLPSVLFGGGAAVPWLAILVLMAAPTVGGLLQMALSRAREFDADLGAALLTRDPDGLALALQKLERIHRRKLEGLMLPGARIPEPSILRTHPKTEDRIARLMALKTEPIGEEAPRGKSKAEVSRKRPSAVPSIKPKWGRQEEKKYTHYARLIGSDREDLPVDEMIAENPSAEKPIHEPTDNPRIRITRGGVWW